MAMMRYADIWKLNTVFGLVVTSLIAAAVNSRVRGIRVKPQ
jgi:hypothetical protein